MTETGDALGLDQAATYRICVQGELDQDWLGWFDGMSITVESGRTTLTGTIPDQPALHGLLFKIRDLGLPLLSVKRTFGLDTSGQENGYVDCRW
jgi:hypothetical protein